MMDLIFSILFAFGATLFWGIGDFLIQRTTRKIGDVEALAWIGIIGSIGLAPFAIPELRFTTGTTIFLISLGIVVFVASMFNLEAFKRGKLSIVDVILTFELPVTIALSIGFFHERLSLLQIFMVLLVMAGIVLIATEKFSHYRAILEKGVFIAFVAAILTGAVNFMTATGSKVISPIVAVWAPWVLMTLFCLLYIGFHEGLGGFVRNAKDHKSLILWMGIIDTLAWISYAYAVHDYEISIITAIAGGYPAIAMLMGVLVNREKIRWFQYIGAVLALAAGFVLALTL